VTAPLRSGNAIFDVLQLGPSREDSEDLVQTLLVDFGVLAPVVLVLAGGGRYLLADRARAQGGTDLGLALHKAIVEQHGGTIGTTSELGKGMRVEVLLQAGYTGRNGDPARPDFICI
jgi:signal transduction histidine kinase